MKSLTRHLTTVIVWALTVSCVVTFASLYLLGRAQRISTFEAALQDDLRTMASITQIDAYGELFVNVNPKLLPDYLVGGSRFFQLWETTGVYMADRSPSLETLSYRFARPLVASRRPNRSETTLPDGRKVSLIWQRLRAQPALGQEAEQQQVDLLVGRLRHELDQTLWTLALSCVAGSVLLPLMAGVLLTLWLPRALRALHDLTLAMAARDADDPRPFAASTTSEIQTVTHRLNELMTRIAQVRERERSFLVDTAHELRSPLAELQIVVDVALLSMDDTHPQAQSLHQIRDATHRVSRLVQALFRLARYQRRLESPSSEVWLSELVTQVITSAHAPSTQRGLVWQTSIADHIVVHTDPLLLRALLDNLIGNVLGHAKAHSTVRVSWLETVPGPCLMIQNRLDTHPREPDQHPQRIGHGLSMVKLYAQALALQLHTESAVPFFTVTLTFANPRGFP
jgi:signal transduction histidine kinase